MTMKDNAEKKSKKKYAIVFLHFSSSPFVINEKEAVDAGGCLL